MIQARSGAAVSMERGTNAGNHLPPTRARRPHACDLAVDDGPSAALDELGATPARNDLLATSRRLLRRPQPSPSRESVTETLWWARGPR